MKSVFLSKDLLNRSVFIAPANPAGNHLFGNLRKSGCKVEGLIDNLKTGQGISNHPSEIHSDAYIVVAPGPRQLNICQTLRRRGFLQPILMSENDQFRLFHERMLARLTRIFRQIVYQSLVCILAKLTPKSTIVYLASGFVDSNVQLVFDAHQKAYSDKILGLVSCPRSEVPPGFINAEQHRWRTFWGLMRAKVIVIDHELSHSVFDLLRNSVSIVQLWHGLPYKHISGNAHLQHVQDDVFISSSTWYNHHVFCELFKANRFLSLGHPRNDALIQSPEERQFSKVLGISALQQFQRSCSGFLVYMPTYRDSGNNYIPLPLSQLNDIFKETNARLILKLHPFATEAMGDIVSSTDNPLPHLKGFSNIHVFPATEDIYPWLGNGQMLITDYSSVVFDYLLCDKPILYYQYDADEYLKLRGVPIVDDGLFIAGEIARNQQELLSCIRNFFSEYEDTYKQVRENLRQKLGIEAKQATPEILSLIRRY